MSARLFNDLTIDSAPPAARRAMEAILRKNGYLPSAVARLAHSPELLDAFLRLSAVFESTGLDPLSRETVIMTVATRNACHLCVAMHTAKLTGLGTDPALITALREGGPLPDPRLAALRAFTVAAVETAGDVPAETLDAFLAHGYTPRNALEVVLGIGTYTLSTLANRLTGAPIDEPLRAYA